MYALFYILLLAVVTVQLSSCGEYLRPEPFAPTPPIYDLSDLRATYAKKVKTARDKTCESYNTRDSSEISFSYALGVLTSRANSRTSSSAINDPLEMHSDVLCALTSEKDKPIFMPNLSENAGHSILYPGDQNELSQVIEGLRAGFILGHPLVGLMLASTSHQIMGAFRQTGEFYIIDSMGGGLINVNDFANTLNQAKIIDSSGAPIKFFGKSIGTRLQKGGNDCIRLAALYLRQIIKDNDLDAYQKVNGAFVDGILQRFEDIALIDNARKLADVTPTIDRSRDSFMYSWDHRNFGMFHERGWQGIKVGDLRPRSAGGKETEKDKYVLWTNFNGHLWDSTLKRKCNGFKFCLDYQPSTAVFPVNFNKLEDVRTQALNPANPQVQRVTNLDDTLDRFMDSVGFRRGILYARESNEFFVLDLDNGFLGL